MKKKKKRKRKLHSKASRPQCLWITCFLRAAWRVKTTNSPGDQQTLINVKEVLVMCSGRSSSFWTEPSQHSKSLCLQFNILICSKATQQSIFVAVFHNFLGPGMSANYKCSPFFYATTEIINFSAWVRLFRLAFNVAKWVVGHKADKPQVEDREGRSWGSFTFTLSLNSITRQAPNLGNHCAISQTQIECDS